MAVKDGLLFRDGSASSHLFPLSLVIVSLCLRNSTFFIPLPLPLRSLISRPFLINFQLQFGLRKEFVSGPNHYSKPTSKYLGLFHLLPVASHAAVSLALVSLLILPYSPHLSLIRERKERGDGNARGVQLLSWT